MKWTRYRIKTTTEASELVVAMLVENGIDGVEIEDNTGISEENSTDNPVSETPKARVKAICPSIEAIRRKSL